MNQFTKPMPIFIIQKHCPFVSLISIILQMAYIRLYRKIHWHFEWWTDAKYTTGFYWLRCLRRQFWSMITTTLWLIKLYFFCTFFFKKNPVGLSLRKKHIKYKTECCEYSVAIHHSKLHKFLMKPHVLPRVKCMLINFSNGRWILHHKKQKKDWKKF